MKNPIFQSVLYALWALSVVSFISACSSSDQGIDQIDRNNSEEIIFDLPTADTVDTHNMVAITREPIPQNLQAYQLKEHAFDQLYFGMSSVELDSFGNKRSVLGKYQYHLDYTLNQLDELYSITIYSQEVRSIEYETTLQAIHHNLCRIISERYGNKENCGTLPSLFDVMNAGSLTTQQWKVDAKTINLGIRHTQPNGFIVRCRIFHDLMEKEEQARLYKIKNKDIIEAADKF